MPEQPSNPATRDLRGHRIATTPLRERGVEVIAIEASEAIIAQFHTLLPQVA